LGVARADTSDVKSPAPVLIAKSGQHCKDDPNCFNRIHHAIKPVAHVEPGQHFLLETRDGLDSDLNWNSTAQDVAAINLNLCHPLTGPVYINGAKRGDAIALTVLDIAPDEFGSTTIFERPVSRSVYRALGAQSSRSPVEGYAWRRCAK